MTLLWQDKAIRRCASKTALSCVRHALRPVRRAFSSGCRPHGREVMTSAWGRAPRPPRDRARVVGALTTRRPRPAPCAGRRPGPPATRSAPRPRGSVTRLSCPRSGPEGDRPGGASCSSRAAPPPRRARAGSARSVAAAAARGARRSPLLGVSRVRDRAPAGRDDPGGGGRRSATGGDRDDVPRRRDAAPDVAPRHRAVDRGRDAPPGAGRPRRGKRR